MAEWGCEYSHGGLLQNIDTSQLGNFKQVTSSASANTLGSWTDLTTSLSKSCQGLLVSYACSSSNVSCLMDIGVDTSGGTSYQVIVDRVLWASHQLRTVEWFYVPVAVPAGSRVAARHQCSTGSTDLRMCIHPYYAGPWSRPAVGSKVVAMCHDVANSSGEQVDPGGTANTYGSWAPSFTTASNDLCAITFKVGGVNNTAPANTSFCVDFGDGTNANIASLRFASGGTGDNYGPVFPAFWVPVSIPSGTSMKMRAKSGTTDATDRLFKYVVYGLVK